MGVLNEWPVRAGFGDTHLALAVDEDQRAASIIHLSMLTGARLRVVCRGARQAPSEQPPGRGRDVGAGQPDIFEQLVRQSL